jgi:hypothetical protein
MKRPRAVRRLLPAAILGLCAATGTAAAQNPVPVTPGAAAVQIPVRTPLQGFSVVLVAGDVQAGQPSDEVPVAARRALADMRDFLPYRSYRLLDTAWMLGSLPVRAATTRMRGPNNRPLDVVVNANPTAGSNLTVNFRLTDVAADAGVGEAEARLRRLREQRGFLEREQSGRETAAALSQRIQELDAQIAKTADEAHARQSVALLSGATAAKVIDTSFTMDIGETVVVGTSRIQGDTALIVLLTAVPRGAK